MTVMERLDMTAEVEELQLALRVRALVQGSAGDRDVYLQLLNDLAKEFVAARNDRCDNARQWYCGWS